MARVLFLLALAPCAARCPHGCNSETTAFACNQFDDDTTYTASYCDSYDGKACARHCAANSTCDLLCGSGNTSCADGGGAVCAMGRLANINATCAEISAIRRRLQDVGATGGADPAATADGGAAAPSDGGVASPSDGDAPTTESSESDDASSQPAGGGGCDDHVYCKFCRGSESCEYLIEHASEFSSVRVSNDFGPLALSLLENIDLICANNSAAEGAYSVADDFGVEGKVSPTENDPPVALFESSTTRTGGALLAPLVMLGITALAAVTAFQRRGGHAHASSEARYGAV